MKRFTSSVCLAAICASALSSTLHSQWSSQNTNRRPDQSDFVINRFDRPQDVAKWRFESGLPGSSASFDAHEDAGGGTHKGSMKLVLPFNKDGEFDFVQEAFPNGVDLKVKGYKSLSLDVKVDSKSPAWGDFHAGWFELGITAGKDGHTFVKQYGENLNTRNGWFHIAVPIVGDASSTRGFGIKFFASGLTSGNRTVWIDNLILSKTALKVAARVQAPVLPLTPATRPAVGAEMLANGDFRAGISKWVIEQSGSAKGTAEVVPEGPDAKPSLRLKVLAVDDHAWHLQIYQTGMRMEKGRNYSMTFWARAAQPGVITAECNQNHEPWEHQTNVKLPITTDWTLLHFNFTGPWDDDNLRISFTDLGTVTGQTYWFAGCSLKPIN